MTRTALLFAAVLLSLILCGFLPPLLVERGVPPAFALLVFPLAIASSLFISLYYAMPPGAARDVVPSLLAALCLQLPSVLAVGAQGLPIIGGVVDKFLNFMKFVAALAFLGFAFMMLSGIRMLGKPGAFIAAVGSLALASAIAFERVMPMGVGGPAGVDLGRLSMVAVVASVIFLFLLFVAGRGRE
jgi:hypothetical protein